MRVISHKSWVVFPTVVLCLLLAYGTGWAAFKKQIQVQPLAKPWNFSGDYDPGALISNRIKSSLKNVDYALLVESDKNPAQLILKGRILKFIPDIPRVGSDSVSIESFKEQAEVAVEIDIVSGSTGRILASGKFQATSMDGTAPFSLPEISNASIGIALENLIVESIAFVLHELRNIPLEARIISIDENSEEVLINVGRANGIEPSDDFAVLSVSENYIDPVNESDLGERYIHKGVIRIKSVNEGFSKGVIMAGDNFSVSDVVRGRENTPLPVESTDSEFPAVSVSDSYNWDDYRSQKQGVFRTFRTPYGEFDVIDLMTGGFLLVLLIG